MFRDGDNVKGETPPMGQIIPFGQEPHEDSPQGAQRRLGPKGLMVAGCLWCVAGSALGLMAGPAGALFVGFGASLLAHAHGRRGVVVAVAVTIAATLVAALLDGSDPYGLVVCMVSALVMGGLAGSGHSSANASCLVLLATAAAYFGIDAVLAWLDGTNIAAYMTESIHWLTDAVLSQAGTSVSVAAQVQVVERVFEVLWPSAYAVVALADVACAAYGARAALRRLGAQDAIRPFREFDLPLWVGYCLLAGIVGLVVGGSLPVAQEAVRMVSANVLFTVRLGLGISGLAVLLWFLESHGVRGAAKGLALVFGVVLDVQFFVLAVVGLIDVWANFRHLARGGDPAPREP